MVVGYSLGNRNEEDINILTEEESNVITYSRTLPIILTRTCRNNCPYCGFQKRSNLTIPYTTIKQCKRARENGCREVLYVAGERPDIYPNIRTNLDLWGFASYLDYLYTICELGFLEGLIPVLEIGFMKPDEMRKMSEICALFKIMLDSVDDKIATEMYKESPGKKLELRLKLLEWAGKLNVPTVTGLMIGLGETKTHKKFVLHHIADIHKRYGTIHEVLLQNFIPVKGTPFETHKSPKKKEILETFEMAKSILPEDINVIVPIECNTQDMKEFIKAGIRDIGRIYEGNNIVTGQNMPVDITSLRQISEEFGLDLQQRFPLRKSFIREGKYSKKLGQVFDSYRYKIKKEKQEKEKIKKEKKE